MHVKRGLTCRFCFTSLIEMLVRVRSLGTSKLLSKNIVQIVHYVSFLFPRLLLFDEHKRFIARYLVDERVTLGKSIIKCRSVYLLILLQIYLHSWDKKFKVLAINSGLLATSKYNLYLHNNEEITNKKYFDY